MPTTDSVAASMAAHNRAVVRRCIVGIAAIVVVSCTVAAIVRGWNGLLGAALGSVVVLAFFGVDLLAYRLTRNSSPTAIMATVVGVYIGKIVVFGLLVVLLVRVVTFDHPSFALAALAAIAVLVVTGIIASTKLRLALVEA
jgi:ATP synthase protein I